MTHSYRFPWSNRISFPFFPFSSQIWTSWSSHNKTILNFVCLKVRGNFRHWPCLLRFVFTCEGLFFSVHQGIFTWWWIHLHIVFKVKIEIVQTNQTNIVFWQISDLTTLSLSLIMTRVNVCSLNGELRKTKLKLLIQICDVSSSFFLSFIFWNDFPCMFVVVLLCFSLPVFRSNCFVCLYLCLSLFQVPERSVHFLWASWPGSMCSPVCWPFLPVSWFVCLFPTYPVLPFHVSTLLFILLNKQTCEVCLQCYSICILVLPLCCITCVHQLWLHEKSPIMCLHSSFFSPKLKWFNYYNSNTFPYSCLIIKNLFTISQIWSLCH